MYYWSRHDSSLPLGIATGSPTLTPSKSWGTPEAVFPTTHCDFNRYFSAHSIIINLSFCVSITLLLAQILDELTKRI